MQTSRRSRTRAAAIGAVLAVLAGTGCGGQTVEVGGQPDVPSALTESAAALPETEPPAPVLPAPETGLPTLPPGDPGNDSAATPHEEEENHDLPPRTDVPLAAVLDAVTVGAIAGGTWQAVAAPTDSCATPRPARALVARTVAWKATGGLIINTVSVYPNGEAAEEAVPATTSRLTNCGWSKESAPAIGEAAAQLRRVVAGGVQRVVIVAVEGVSVTLVTTGAVAAEDKLSGLVDVAANSSCAAAADGCH